MLSSRVGDGDEHVGGTGWQRGRKTHDGDDDGNDDDDHDEEEEEEEEAEQEEEDDVEEVVVEVVVKVEKEGCTLMTATVMRRGGRTTGTRACSCKWGRGK